jgi:hypothetical protein
MNLINEFITHLSAFCKSTLLLILSGLASIFSPIQNVLLLLFGAFLFNIILGLAADIHAHKQHFSLKKAFDAILQLTFYTSLLIFIRNGAQLLKDNAMGEFGVKWVTYVVVYFYLTNILRNTILIFPRNKAIAFMYKFLTTEIMNRIKSTLSIFVLFLSLTACHTTQKTSEFQQTKSNSQNTDKINQQEAEQKANATLKLNQTDELEGDFNQTITNYFKKTGGDATAKPTIKSTITSTGRWHRNRNTKQNEKSMSIILSKNKSESQVSKLDSSVSKSKLDQASSPYTPWKWFLFGIIATVSLLFTWKISHSTFLPS